MRDPVISYRRGFSFDVAPEVLWDRIEEIDQFEHWWPWLTECRLDGEGLRSGAVLTGVVTPPLPYRMRIRVELDRCDRPNRIEATVGGDLDGTAALALHADGRGTRADVAWTVEMRQPTMRLADRFGHPLLQWGHDRVVEMTVAGFRRRIERR